MNSYKVSFNYISPNDVCAGKFYKENLEFFNTIYQSYREAYLAMKKFVSERIEKILKKDPTVYYIEPIDKDGIYVQEWYTCLRQFKNEPMRHKKAWDEFSSFYYMSFNGIAFERRYSMDGNHTYESKIFIEEIKKNK